MTIKVVKQGTFNAKPSGLCPFMVDAPVTQKR